MSRFTALDYSFVRLIPDVLDEGVLYISTEFGTAVHLCCCGCSERVVTPLSPAQWSITFDGESVSLWPSVGNHDLECRSHYVIRRNRVRWARAWTKEEIVAGRRADQQELNAHFADVAPEDAATGDSSQLRRARQWKARFRRLFRR